MYPNPNLSWYRQKDPARQARDNSLEAYMVVNAGLRRQVEDLTKEKRRLLDELSKRQRDYHCVLNLHHVHGYLLKDFLTNTDNAGRSYYSATCQDNFKIAVIEEEGVVKSVSVAVLQNSPLTEIQKVLSDLSEELCPRRVLMTIQQFIHMDQFRVNIVSSLIQPKPRCFRFYIPNETKGNIQDSQLCSIRAYIGSKSIMDLQWTFSYSSERQSLVHHFFTKSLPTVVPEEVIKFSVALKSESYTSYNENELRELWYNFCEWVGAQKA